MEKSLYSVFARSLLVPCAAALLLTSGCGRSSERAADDALRPALVHYATLAHVIYGDAYDAARGLEQALGELSRTPTENTLARARAAYLTARVPYRVSEVYRFYGGPIDAVEVAVNTWPIDENFIESSSPAAPGIVDDVAQYPELTRALLVELNARDGETTISTGFHAIEFLLWGRDERTDGPGERRADAFTDERLGARRLQYLELASALLVDQLGQVRDAWQPGKPDNYRAEFLALPPRVALERALRGVGALSGPELAGERLTVAYETRDQENEQSCFSDSTSEDIAGNARGVQVVCRGSYHRPGGGTLSGPGLCDAVSALDDAQGSALVREVDEAARRAVAIPSPFDRAVLGPDSGPGRSAIASAVRALRAQATRVERVNALLRAPALASTP